MAASSSATSSTDMPRIAVPAEYFVYVGEAEKDGNSLYRCLKLLEKTYWRTTPGFPGGYVTLNTGLLLSASVERLFSLGGGSSHHCDHA